MRNRIDPTGTSSKAKQLSAKLAARFRWLATQVDKLLIDENAFGLDPTANTVMVHNSGQFVFLSNVDKVAAFRRWLKDQIKRGILTTDQKGKPWTAEFLFSVYKKGIVDAYIEANRADITKLPKMHFQGTSSRDEFLRQAFAAPVTTRKLELIYTRDFTQLSGITDGMDAQLSAILATGVANGSGARPVAREIRKTIDSIGRYRSELLARTELVRVYVEGQLDSFERLGIADELELVPEWTTSGIGVCPRCIAASKLSYTLETARGMIPLHPLCVVGESVIRASDVTAVSRAEYTGEIFEVVTSKGRRISITANHMLMTEFGFVPAHLMYEGLHLVNATQGNLGSTDIIDPNNNSQESCISDIFASLSKTIGMMRMAMPVSAEDFHGDGKFCQSEIDIIWPDSILADSQNSSRVAEIQKSPFICGSGNFGFSSDLDTAGFSTELLEGMFTPSDFGMGGFRDALAFLLGRVLKSQQVGISPVAGTDAIHFQNTINGISGTTTDFRHAVRRHPILKHLENFIDWEVCCISLPQLDASFFKTMRQDKTALPSFSGNRANGLSILEPLDQIIQINVRHVVALPVFDVSTESSIYDLNGIMSSNCRCCWRLRPKKKVA